MKTVLVTGVSRGIGRGIAEYLLSEGYKIIGTYNTGEEEVKSLNKGIELFKVDFSIREQTLNFCNKIKSRVLFAIVNNAGTFFEEDFNNFDYAGWDEVIEVNLNAPLIIALELKNSIVEGGSIVNISSTDGYTGCYGSMSYSASKAALSNLTKSLSNNLASKNIRVNAVCPGWIDTGMSTDASYKATHVTPVGRNGKPEEIAAVVGFLISDKASFVTGSNLFADGGYTNVDVIMKEEAGLIKVNFE